MLRNALGDADDEGNLSGKGFFDACSSQRGPVQKLRQYP